MKEMTVTQKVSDLMDSGELTEWEYDFIYKIADVDEDRMTQQQLDKVEEIWYKIFG